MKNYQSDGTRLTNVEFDDRPGVGDLVDGMLVLSVNERSDGYAVFIQEPNLHVGVLVLDDNYIIGRVFGFETLVAAAEAWRDGDV